MLTALRLIIQFITVFKAAYKRRMLTITAFPSREVHNFSSLSLLQPFRQYQKYIAQIILASYLSMPGVLLAQGVSAAANSAHAPSFDTAANGTPIVNINAPSSKGVSRNEYKDLNVDSIGLIFNNATDITNTKLAGYIDGNSKLNGNSANIILNEVKGNSRSALNGFMEIAGRSAELIIANQNGITCNGCGFINTTRGTLTTGLPTFDGAGGLTGFDVSRGDVDISGLGLNASNVDEVDILARSVSLNSKFWAKNATIVTGQNHINYQDKKVTAALGSSGSGISLDVAAIGGMYANRIRLIGTEKGLGVNIAGEIKATENMVLDSQGNLSNSGTISAKTLSVSSKGINNTGNVLGNTISIDADLLDNNSNTANVQAVNSVSIKLKDGLTNRNGARILSKDGLISIDSGSVSNQSTVAANNIVVKASSFTNNTSDGQIISSGRLDLTLTGNANNTDGAMIHADKALTLNASGDLTNTDSTIETVETATINSQNVINSGTILAKNGTLTVKTNKVDNQGALGGNGITFTATDLDNSTVNGKILSSYTLDLTLTGNANNTDGAMIHADKALTLNASGDLTNTDSTIETVETATINSQNVINSGTILAKNGTLTVKTNQVDNQGVFAGNGIIINANQLDNHTTKGNLYSTDILDLTIEGSITNKDQALIHSDKTLYITSVNDDLINTNASIESADSINLNSQNLYNSATSKVLAQNGGLTIQTSTLDNQGSLSGHGLNVNATVIKNNTSTSKILSSEDLALTTEDSFSNVNGAQVKANNTLTINTKGDLNNTGSLLESVNNITLNSRNLNNASTGTISAQNGTLSITNSGGSLNNQGGIAGSRVIVNAAGVSNAGSSALILGRDYLDIRSTGNITNQDGAVLYSLGDGVIKASNTLTNSSATIETGRNLAIEANQITNKKRIFSASQTVTSQSYTGVGIGVPGGYYQAKRDYSDTITTPYVVSDSAQAYILSGGNMSIMGKIDNIYSTVSAVGNLNFTASQLNNQFYTADKTIVSTGVDTLYRTENYCKRRVFGHCISERQRTKIDTRGYNNTSSLTVTLASATFTAGGNITGKAGSVNNKGKVDEVAKATASKDKLPSAFDATNEDILKVRRDEIFGGNLFNYLVSSALFKETDSPDQKYLIETNPLFTNYKTFISSDYLLSKMTGDDVGRTGKTTSRLGDGYLEQKLVRDQILSYTGYQTLPDSLDIESTFATLMNNAVEEYKDLGLSTGVELSSEQITALKKPIVWMVIETVQTASGPKQALVPKVYFANTSEMALRPDGALIAATNINIDAQEDINNSGSMLATVDLSLKGSSIGNDGTIQAGGNASLNASGDIANSGSLQAGGTLGLVAGGNITSETKTQVLTHQRGNHSATETLVGSTATLKGNNVSLSAGNNITLKGTDVRASEQVFVSAGNNFTLESLAVTNSSKDGNNYDSSNTTQQVSNLSGNNIQLKAGNTLTSEGAQINASGNLALAAKNIDLLAVTDSKDNYSFIGGGGNSTEKRTHNETLTGTTLNAGGTLSLVSQQDIFSKGSSLSGGDGIALAAGGDVILASAEANNTSFEEVKKKKSGFFGSKKSTKTTTSESLTNLGTSLISGGDIQMVSGSDIILSGTKATAAGGIDLQAKGDIQLLSAVDQTSSRYQEQKKGTFKVKAKDQGSIKQTAVTSELIANGTSGEGNIVLTSGSNITLEGATLAANDTLSMGAGSETQEAVTKDANGNYVNADGALAGNVTVGTQALQSSEWNESSSGYRGILKDLARGVSVVASSMGGKGEIKVGESHATRTDTLKQQTSTLAANDLNIDAQNDVALIGATVAVTDTASINAQNVTIDAAQEQTIVTESHTDHTISSEGATLEKDQISLVSLTETKQTERTTTTANTWAGSNISAGNLSINGKQNVAIIASDINVQNNASITGENILVGGREATTDTTHDSITETKTLTVGVKNAYVDVVLAAQALKDAKDAVSDAKNAYDDAKQKVAEGKLPVSDLDFYKVNLAAATANVASATTAVTSAGATAAASTGTYGFTINGGVTTQTDTTSTTSTQGTWNGTNINVGNSANLTSNNNLNIEGSNINTAGQLALDAKNINITAGKNTYTENTESHSEGASASYGSSGGYSGSVNGSKSNSDSQSTQYVNSGLNAGSIVSNSDNLTIEGGNLNATDIDITTDNLVVTSLQDTSTSSSKSSGGSVGIGSSNNVGINASQSNADSAWVNQQSGITGGTVNITAKDTSLTGAVIAAVDEEGNSTDKLTLTTDTLTVADLQDTDNSKSMGMDLSLSTNTTKVGGSFNGHEKEQTTKATVGLGNVTVGGLSIEESIDQQPEFANLNRDAANSQEITKDMERGGVDISLTVDNRMLTENGRNSIKKDILDTEAHAGEIAQAIEDVSNTDQGILDVFGNVQNYAKERIVLTQKAMDEAAQKKLRGEEGAAGSQEGMQDLSDALSKEQGLAENAKVEVYDGSQVEDDSVSIDKTAVNKTEVEGAYHQNSNTILANIDKTDMTDSSKVAATVVHEQTRHRLAQEGQTETLSRDDQTTLATNHGDRAGEVWTAYSGLAGISTQSNTSQSTWNAVNRNSSVVQAGTNHIAGINNNELKARQLNNKELDYINFTASSDYAAKKGITPEQAKKELMRGAALDADTDWEKAYETYTEEEVDAYKAANEYLAQAAEQEGFTFTNEKGQEQAAYTSTEEQRNNHDLNLKESLGDDSYIANVGIADEEKNWIQKNSEINKKILKGAIGFSNGISNSVVDTYNTAKALASTDTEQLESMGKGLKAATDAFNNDPELVISTVKNETAELLAKWVDKTVQIDNKITLLEAQGRGDEAVELEAEIVGGQVDPTAKILTGITIISKAGNKLNKTVKVVEEQTAKTPVTKETILKKLDELPDGQGENYTVRQNSNGSYSAVRKDVEETEAIKVTEEGDLYSPVKFQSGSQHQVVQNKLDGSRREAEVKRELELANPTASVQSEHYLRNTKGDIVVDELTGEARRVDHVVIENGQVKDMVETTSINANKTKQQAKEERIINEQGGNYIRDKETGCVLEITCKVRLDRRD